MTSWQDWVLAATVLGFNLALVPSLWGNAKPRLTTSVVTALFLIPQAIVFTSLSLWYSLGMVLLNLVLWSTLAVQAIRKKSSKKRK